MAQNMGFRVEITGFRNSRGQFASLANALPGGAYEVHQRIGPQLQNKFEMRTPVVSGTLAAGWAHFVERSDDGAELTFENNVGYLDAVLKGRRPGYMYAKNAEYMHFFWHGKEWFMKRVYHPGTKPNNFLQGIDDEYIRFVTPEMEYMAQILVRRYLTNG